MITVDHLTIDFTGTPLFEDITFLVNAKEKIALVGKNGAGKTTLLKLFAGKQPPTSGRMSMPKDITIRYLPQHLLLHDQPTLMEQLPSSFADIIHLHKQM